MKVKLISKTGFKNEMEIKELAPVLYIPPKESYNSKWIEANGKMVFTTTNFREFHLINKLQKDGMYYYEEI